MKKSIWIFFLAVLLPSVVLGWLALRSAEEQQIILERRTAELYQSETEQAAAVVRALIDEERRAFNEAVRRLLAKAAPEAVAADFASALGEAWPRSAIGFAIAADGRLCSPTPQRAQANRDWQQFLAANSAFLANAAPATAYRVTGEDLAKPEPMRNKSKADGIAQKLGGAFDLRKSMTKEASLPEGKTSGEKSRAPAILAETSSAAPSAPKSEKSARFNQPAPAASAPAEKSAPAPGKDLSDSFQQDAPAPQQQTLRNVAPQRQFADEESAAVSNLTAATAPFRELTGGSDEGVLTRFVEDKLEIIFWLRPASASGLLFGCLLRAENLRDLWTNALPAAAAPLERDGGLARNGAPEFILALLDDKARPVATQPPGTAGRDWKRPFVASEIGEALPHWEAALYLQRPEQLQESARVVRRTLTFLIAAALAIIACGGWLVVADARRQLALAQQKTDFVSNVSHELKTPLTSIRMFAELMQSGRGEAVAKQGQYLRIIMVEAERLTRLINNVLDFARLERRQKQFDLKPLDLFPVIERTWEGCELHLREAGFTTDWQAAPPPYPVVGDEDALAQILVNLLSNAEKYAGEKKEVTLHTYLDAGSVFVSVLDRGAGVPAGEERKIFESFYRAHDSLSSGIPGSGLGLTLAQRLAAAHGGEIVLRPRAGGGSDFTLRLPLAQNQK